MTDSHGDAAMLDHILAHQKRLQTTVAESQVQSTITDFFTT